MKIASTTAGAAVYYTTDGSTPTVNSILYTGPILIPNASAVETVRAISVLNGVASWSSASAVYTITPPLPAPSMAPGSTTLAPGQAVVLTSATPGAVIHYTTNGTMVTASSPVYTGPITLTSAASIIAAAAGVSGYSMSPVVRCNYTVATPTPAITPVSGNYSTPPVITMTDSATGANIYYTLDGSVPTAASALYTGPFSLAATTSGVTAGTKTVQAVAIAPGFQTSAIATSLLQLTLPNGVIASAVVTSTATTSISPNFLGLSHGWSDAQTMMGSVATGTDPIYTNLVSQLSQTFNGNLVVRVGGGSTDTSGLANATTVEPMVELAQKLPVKFILGVNLGADNLSLAQEQGSTFVNTVPSANLMALEVGNEPDGYAGVYRPASYSYANFLPEYQQWQAALKGLSQTNVPVSGPTLGTGSWDPNASASISAGALQADIVTQHEYLACYNSASPFPSNYLLQPASAQMHFWTVAPFLAAAHAAKLPFRIAEMNSICMGGQPGLSNSFSSALWAVDAMFEYINIGVDGVNWHTSYMGGPYDLFQIHVWQKTPGINSYTLGNVAPLYYGLLFFSRAAGNSAKLLPVSTLTNSNLKIWATTDSNGKDHLVIINKEQTTAGNVQLNLNGFSSGTVTRLSAAGGYLATNGLTFGGQTYDNSPDGSLQGSPTTEQTLPSGGLWTISVQPMSAVLVDLQP